MFHVVLAIECGGSGDSHKVQANVSHHMSSVQGIGMGYKVISRWFLLVLGLEVLRPGQAVK